MKKLYRKILKYRSNSAVRLEKTKAFIAEWCGIFRKKKLYKNVKWTKEQKKEFKRFWKENYGKKISSRWHKLYEASNGVYKVDYFPEILYSTKLEFKLNNYSYSSVLADKTMLDVLFDGKYAGVRTPKSFIFNSHGHFYSADRSIISKEEAITLVSNIGYAVIKPTVDSSSGKNVRIVNFENGVDIKKKESVKKIFDFYGDNFVVQEKIKPHEELEKIYPNSINTFRVISYIVDDVIDVAPISLRIGGGGSEVDNIHAGGMSISVKRNGNLAKKAYRLGYGDSFESFDVHPDTKILFETYRISFVERLIDAAKKLHSNLVNVGVVSWDFTIDSVGDIVVVEVNLKGQSAWFPQMLSGESLFGKNTTKILKYIGKK